MPGLGQGTPLRIQSQGARKHRKLAQFDLPPKGVLFIQKVVIRVIKPAVQLGQIVLRADQQGIPIQHLIAELTFQALKRLSPKMHTESVDVQDADHGPETALQGTLELLLKDQLRVWNGDPADRPLAVGKALELTMPKVQLPDQIEHGFAVQELQGAEPLDQRLVVPNPLQNRSVQLLLDLLIDLLAHGFLPGLIQPE